MSKATKLKVVIIVSAGSRLFVPNLAHKCLHGYERYRVDADATDVFIRQVAEAQLNALASEKYVEDYKVYMILREREHIFVVVHALGIALHNDDPMDRRNPLPPSFLTAREVIAKYAASATARILQSLLSASSTLKAA